MLGFSFQIPSSASLPPSLRPPVRSDALLPSHSAPDPGVGSLPLPRNSRARPHSLGSGSRGISSPGLISEMVFVVWTVGWQQTNLEIPVAAHNKNPSLAYGKVLRVGQLSRPASGSFLRGHLGTNVTQGWGRRGWLFHTLDCKWSTLLLRACGQSSAPQRPSKAGGHMGVAKEPLHQPDDRSSPRQPWTCGHSYTV